MHFNSYLKIFLRSVYILIRSGHGLQLNGDGLRIWIDWDKALVSGIYEQVSLLSNQLPSIFRTVSVHRCWARPPFPEWSLGSPHLLSLHKSSPHFHLWSANSSNSQMVARMSQYPPWYGSQWFWGLNDVLKCLFLILLLLLKSLVLGQLPAWVWH